MYIFLVDNHVLCNPCVLRFFQRILAEKKARYSELAKRLEREKTLALMERRMEIKRHLQVRTGREGSCLWGRWRRRVGRGS